MSVDDRRKLFDKMTEALLGFEVEELKKTVLEAIQIGIKANEVIEVLSKGMTIIGEKYQTGEYFVTELIIAGETMKETLAVLEPYIEEKPEKKAATVVVATVLGDIHDIGKNIFVMLLNTAGFNVIDLGVDISADDVVNAVKEHGAGILGLSALLTTNLEQFPIIVNKLKSEGLRDRVKVIVGGATVTEDYAKRAGVDAYVKTAVEGVEICKEWVK
jgi:methylmalonyl-CoA mutase cobalamin-binding domain/chain